MQTCIVAECHGNKCLGEYLRADIGGEVFHKRNYGRELILRSIVDEVRPRCRLLLVMIDYETSRDARQLVEANFELRQVCQKVWLGLEKGKLAGVVAVVLDPHVESFAEWLGLNPGDNLKGEDVCTNIQEGLEGNRNAYQRFYDCLQRLRYEAKSVLAQLAQLNA